MLNLSSTNFKKRRNIYGKLLNLKERTRRREDPLFFILLLTQFPWKIKFFKVTAFLLAIQSSLEVIDFSLNVLINFEKKFLLTYGGHVGMWTFVLVTIGNVILTGDSVIDFVVQYKTKKTLPWDLNGKKIYRKMISECLFLKIWVFTITFTAISHGLTYFFNDAYIEHAVLLGKLYRNLFPDIISTILMIHFKCSGIYCAIICIVGALILSHFCFNAAFQLRIIQGLIANICDSNFEEKHQYNETTQKCITQRLKICIFLHQIVIRETNVLTTIIYKGIVFYTIGVLALGAGLMIIFFANDTNGPTKVMVGTAVVCGILTTCLYAFIGQMLKDESENLHRSLINLPWYNMNKQNKLMYTIFLIRSEKAISLDIQLIQIDYLLLVRIFRALYTISTVVNRATGFQK